MRPSKSKMTTTQFFCCNHSGLSWLNAFKNSRTYCLDANLGASWPQQYLGGRVCGGGASRGLLEFPPAKFWSDSKGIGAWHPILWILPDCRNWGHPVKAKRHRSILFLSQQQPTPGFDACWSLLQLLSSGICARSQTPPGGFYRRRKRRRKAACPRHMLSNTVHKTTILKPQCSASIFALQFIDKPELFYQTVGVSQVAIPYLDMCFFYLTCLANHPNKLSSSHPQRSGANKTHW